MYNKRPLFQVALACSLFLSCTGQRNSISTPVQSLKSDVLVACNKTLTDAIVSRHFTPPVAARNYSYPNIGVYLALQPVDHVGSSFIDDLRDLNWKKLQPSMKYMNWELVAMHTFYTIAYPLIYKDAAIKDPHEKSLKRFEEALSSKAYKMSIAYAEEVASKVLAWAEQDNYLKTRGLPYTLAKQVKASGLPPRRILWMPLSPIGIKFDRFSWIRPINL